MTIDLVITHAPEDDALCAQLEGHLAGLRKEGALRVWSERCVRAGDEPAAVRVARLQAAQVVLVLVSAAYLESEQLDEVRTHAGRARLIPVALRDCIWTSTAIEGLQPLPVGKPAVTLWSDRDAAWRAVVEGLLVAVAEVHKAPAAPPEAEIHRGVETVFAGRVEELAALRAALLGGDSKPVMIGALQGMAGVGKSYLADRFAFEHRADFPGGYVKVSLDPATAATVEGIEDEIARKLKCARQMVRQELMGRRALLHIENADEEEKAAVVAQVAARLGGCAVVISGRSQRIGRARGWQRIEVHELSEELSLELLEQELGAASSDGDRADRKRLAKRVGHLPLALHLAAGYVLEGGTVDRFLKELGRKKLAIGPAGLDDPLMREGAKAILSETFDLSLCSLAKVRGAEADKIFALSHAPPSGVGLSLGAAMAGLDEDAFEELMLAARRLSIVEQVREPSAPAWKVHPLLAELLRTRSSAGWMARMTEWFVERLYAPLVHQKNRWNEVHAESEALVAWLAAVPIEEAARIVEAGMLCATRTGPFVAWMSFCERLLGAVTEPAVRSDVLWTLCNVAFQAGDLTRAETAAREGVQAFRERVADREAAVVASVLADIHEARGDLDEALRIHREERHPVYVRLGDVREQALTLCKIADVLQARGDLDEALRIYRDELLPAFERLGDVRSRAAILGRIADVLQARGDLDEALRIRREEVLPVFERLGDVRARAATLGQIAAVLRARGDLDEALRIHREEELLVFERLGDVRSLLVARTNLAATYLRRAHPEDRPLAASLLHQALAAAEAMRIPEADQIRAFLRDSGLD